MFSWWSCRTVCGIVLSFWKEDSSDHAAVCAPADSTLKLKLRCWRVVSSFKFLVAQWYYSRILHKSCTNVLRSIHVSCMLYMHICCKSFGNWQQSEKFDWNNTKRILTTVGIIYDWDIWKILSSVQYVHLVVCSTLGATPEVGPRSIQTRLSTQEARYEYRCTI